MCVTAQYTMLGATETNPEIFLRSYEHNVILDEVQMAPRLFRTLKMLIDEASANGRYLLTGSASIMALPRLSDALVGTMSVLRLYPLLELMQGKGNFLSRLLDNDFKPDSVKRIHKLAEVVKGAKFPENQPPTRCIDLMPGI